MYTIVYTIWFRALQQKKKRPPQKKEKETAPNGTAPPSSRRSGSGSAQSGGLLPRSARASAPRCTPWDIEGSAAGESWAAGVEGRKENAGEVKIQKWSKNNKYNQKNENKKNTVQKKKWRKNIF